MSVPPARPGRAPTPPQGSDARGAPRDGRPRCPWAAVDGLLARYHDEEWGRPPATEADAFELLTLEVFQGGLAWRTVLARREGFRAAFAGFDAERVAAFGPGDVERLAVDARVIRHRARLAGTVENARALCAARAEWGSGPGDRGAFVRRLRLARDEGGADELSVELQARFRGVGASVARSFLEAAGVVPAPHAPGCWLALAGRPRADPVR